ncbi:hypothetical protein [Variovorax sp. 38R]|uniref:hypothetical protein n=1 Tax=Variovorax sp. 38R TaxID=2774875 RepID=UPI0017814AA9|nr:hypothetical protein [Variovorax sp. 38R]QOF80325.1 hypothetical protein IG196_08040 [Variovorax sp. 38R]
MRRLPDEATAPVTTSHIEVLALDEEFFQRVDRVMLERKQTDPFRRDAVWRATAEEARLRQLQSPHEDPIRSKPR